MYNMYQHFWLLAEVWEDLGRFGPHMLLGATMLLLGARALLCEPCFGNPALYFFVVAITYLCSGAYQVIPPFADISTTGRPR